MTLTDNQETPETTERPPHYRAIRPATTIFDWIPTIIFALFFFSILIAFEVVQWIAFALGRRAHEHTVVLMNRLLFYSLRILGTKFTIENEQQLVPGQPYIIVSNHQSMFDIPLIHTIFSRHFPRFIAKRELVDRWIPGVSFNLKYGQNAVIDRANAKQAITEIERLGTTMNERGFASVLFPEGTRARDGTLKKYRYAGFASLLQSSPRALIVPVVLDGSWKLVPEGVAPIPRNIEVKVVVGQPRSRGDHESLGKLINEIYDYTEQTLQRLRSG